LEAGTHIIQCVNPAFCLLAGQTKEKLIGSDFTDLTLPERTFCPSSERVYRTGKAGTHMPASSTKCFAQRGQAAMPPGLKLALGPMLEQNAEMTLQIKQYDREIQRMTQTEYAETQPLLATERLGSADGVLNQKGPDSRLSSPGCTLISPARPQSRLKRNSLRSALTMLLAGQTP
jgi:hypothetical protein